MSQSLQVLILGADTAIGRVLVEQTQSMQIPLRAIHDSDWDLTNATLLESRLSEFEPTYVVNCLSADHDSMTVALGQTLARTCQKLGIKLLQISSNRVFDQQEGEVFNEEDEPKPKSDSGQRAVAIEEAIAAYCQQHLILRVGWIFSSHSEDDVSRLLDLAQRNTRLSLSDNRYVCPTSVCDIATIILGMVHQSRYADLWGTYHYCSAEQTTLFKFAEVLVAEARQYENLSVNEIYPDANHDMNNLFAEASPKLITKKILYTFGIKPKPWRQALSRVLRRRYAQAAA